MLSLDLILFPPGSILFLMVLAFVISLSINLINKKQIDYNRMRELQKIINEYTKLQREALKDPENKKLKKKLDRMKPQFDAARSEMSKMNLKPMLYTTLPILIIFWALGSFYSEIPVAKLPFPLPFILDYFHGSSALSNQVVGYLGFYIVCSFLFSMILQRILGTSLTQ
ncbi:MAG: TMCO1/EMC3 family protein [Candidatus Korarchaeota archaeon]|nr:TMCO1/EMC3 family protein [Candidatus Korarchaeota archaeon]